MTKGCGHILLPRLPIEKCKVAIVNTHCGTESEIHEALPYDVRNIDILLKGCEFVCIIQIHLDLSVSVHSFVCNKLTDMSINLVKDHFGLKSTLISNIPMKVRY